MFFENYISVWEGTVKRFIEQGHTFRFNHQINSLAATTDRELFESSFIRYTFDKGDLTQEEVDQYIVLATEVVIAANIQGRIEHLQGLLDDSADDSDEEEAPRIT